MDKIPPFLLRPWNGVRHMLRPLSVPISGLTAQRQRIDTIAQNIANVETTRTASGDPYRRQFTVLERDPNGGVRVAGVQEDQSQFIEVYDPGHEDADELGYVRLPNVDIHTEMADMMVAHRMFEANATVFDAAKAMLRRALEI